MAKIIFKYTVIYVNADRVRHTQDFHYKKEAMSFAKKQLACRVIQN